MTPEIRIGKPFSRNGCLAHTRSPSIHPVAFISYEHMFPSSRTSTLAQRALDALRLTRSFLLLEDDHDVDWEVGQDEPTQAIHPHRAPLRGRRAARRRGQPAPAPQVCVSPIRRSESSVLGRRHQPSPAHEKSHSWQPDR
jgi:hypothetical protein